MELWPRDTEILKLLMLASIRGEKVLSVGESHVCQDSVHSMRIAIQRAVSPRACALGGTLWEHALGA